MLALTQKNTPIAQEINYLKEAIRRYRLPFGIAGKHSSFKRAKESNFPKTAHNIVLQDFRILTPPEYIFGLQPGDCVSITVDIFQYRPEYNTQIELLANTFQPAFVIVAAGNETPDTSKALHRFAASVSCNMNIVRNRFNKKPWEVLVCSIDERFRDVAFI